MDIWQHFRSFAASVGWSVGNEVGTAPNSAQDEVEELQVEELQAESPGSEYSDATTFYEVYSNGPNLPVLPVELFGMIISQISRQDVKNLRLISRQCEAKVSAHYFKEVVVSFGSQFFYYPPGDQRRALRDISASILSNGGRVFDQFGHFIRRFALSLEIDERLLEFPPPKPKQEVIPSFWGLYRWPHKTYSRYQDVSDIENDADELEEMKKAMRCLSSVVSLGLCSDAGLGFLSGPDVIARHNAIRHRVFIHQDEAQQPNKNYVTTPPPVFTFGDTILASNAKDGMVGRETQNWKLDMVKAMLRNAGFRDAQMRDAFLLLLKSENTEQVADMHFDESYTSEPPKETAQADQRELLAPFQALARRPSVPANEAVTKTTDYPLVPSSLTRSQKEMLLELEWAHRAMAQSYILSAIDCSKEGCFQNLTAFNIAKIPSSHLHIISRHDFWDSFPSLKSVSLGVVADWRRVYSSAPGCIAEELVSPLDAVPATHELIKTYISARSNIENFHFEWVCGGEHASGCHQRNQHILPAPFFAAPNAMVQPTMARAGTDNDMLRLPHVKTVSLKNCWVAPHVLLQVLRAYALCSMEKVEFEGVSLSVMPCTTPQNSPPLCLINLGFRSRTNNGHNLVSEPVPSSHWDRELTLEQPSWLSWAGLIEHFSPTLKVRDVIDRRHTTKEKEKYAEVRKYKLGVLSTIIPDADQLPQEETLYNIKSLTFKSCGYVTLPHPQFPINHMIPVSELALLSGSFPLVSEFTPLMQRCKETLMGRVIPFAMLNDRMPLKDVFRLRMGWDGVYDPKISAAALADHCQTAGVGRFSGTVAKGDSVDFIPKKKARLSVLH